MDGEDVRPRLVAEIPGLVRYARSIVRDEALADDLVQETFVKALTKLDTFRADSSLSTWLHRILHNAAIDHLRRHREDAVEDIADQIEALWRDSDYTVDAAVVVARAETSEELKDALLRLPMTYRAAVVLHDMERLTVAEIARVQDVNLPAAKQRLRRGRMMLVSALAGGVERRIANRGVPMNCWDARSMVPEYLDDELAPGDRRRVEQHLGGCSTCPPLLAGLVATSAAVSHLRDSDTVIPLDLVERLAGPSGGT